MIVHPRFLSFFFFFAVLHAHANVGELNGFGSHSGAIAGAVSAGKLDPYAAYSNPATLSSGETHRFHLGVGFLYVQPKFTPIQGIIIENSFNSDLNANQVRYGTADTSYLPVLGQVVGLSLDLFPKFHHLSFGLALFSPVLRNSTVDTINPMGPDYVLWKDRYQRPSIFMGLGANLTGPWHLGAGINIGFETETEAEAFIATDANKTSSARIQTQIDPASTPYFGLLYASSPLRIALVTRLPAKSKGNVKTHTKGEIFSGSGSIGVDFSSDVIHFYEPLKVELGSSYEFQTWTLFAQLEYQRWSEFEPPIMTVIDTGRGIDIQNSKIPNYSFRDIWVPRIGQETRLNDFWVWRAGYAYKPSISSRDLRDSGNLIDPDQHTFTTGMGYEGKTLFGVNLPWAFDFHLLYAWLKKEEIVKSSGGDSSVGNEKIGSPGYTIGGSLYGGGASFRFFL